MSCYRCDCDLLSYINELLEITRNMEEEKVLKKISPHRHRAYHHGIHNHKCFKNPTQAIKTQDLTGPPVQIFTEKTTTTISRSRITGPRRQLRIVVLIHHITNYPADQPLGHPHPI